MKYRQTVWNQSCIYSNTVLRTGNLPARRKVSKIITIPKLDNKKRKNLRLQIYESAAGAVKRLRKLYMKRVKPVQEELNFILDYQFGFRSGHGTTEQIYMTVNKIYNHLESKKYC